MIHLGSAQWACPETGALPFQGFPQHSTRIVAPGLPVLQTSTWSGGVLAPNGKVYMVPNSHSSVLIYDPRTGAVDLSSISGLGDAPAKWLGGVVAGNGLIYGIPFASNEVLVIDPRTEQISTFPAGTRGSLLKWWGGVLTPGGESSACHSARTASWRSAPACRSSPAECWSPSSTSSELPASNRSSPQTGFALLLVPDMAEQDEDLELLAALLDGPFRRLRDTNHLDPHSILVWDRQRQPAIQAVTFLELISRYPCGGQADNQWSASDLVEILQEKHQLLRRSLVAQEIAEEQEDSQPACGTVVLITNADPELPHRWAVIRARIIPRLDEDS